jgi:hypothetical protein
VLLVTVALTSVCVARASVRAAFMRATAANDMSLLPRTLAALDEYAVRHGLRVVPQAERIAAGMKVASPSSCPLLLPVLFSTGVAWWTVAAERAAFRKTLTESQRQAQSHGASEASLRGCCATLLTRSHPALPFQSVSPGDCGE